MALEDGLVAIVQADPTVAGLAPYGGFLSHLPKDIDFSNAGAWTYAFAGGSVEHTLDGERGPRARRLVIDCYGARNKPNAENGDGGDAVALSQAIDDVLEGFTGALSGNPPATGILSCFMEEEPSDFFDEAGRTYRRMTEYMIWFG